MIRTYLDRASFQYKSDYDGSGLWKELCAYQGLREVITGFDPTRPAVFLLFALQSGLTPNAEKVVTLPYGIVIPEGVNFRNYVQAFGVVGGNRVPLTVTEVNEVAGTVKIAETVDSGTTVDVYCVPRIPVLVSFRIENIETGAKVQREILVMDVAADAEREYWKAGSYLLMPSTFAIPEDWLLRIYVRTSLPIKWTDPSGAEILHKIFLPVVKTPAAGKQEALKAELLRTLAV